MIATVSRETHTSLSSSLDGATIVRHHCKKECCPFCSRSLVSHVIIRIIILENLSGFALLYPTYQAVAVSDPRQFSKGARPGLPDF
jgi:hypothetical protein